MFCSACGVSNDASAKFCHACGTPVSASSAAPGVPVPPEGGTMRGGAAAQVLPAPSVTGRNPALAAVLSAVVVGLGQFYNGDTKKGAIMLASALVFGLLTAGLLWICLAIWSAVDAYQVAKGTGRPW